MNPNDPINSWLQEPCSADLAGQILGTLALLAIIASVLWVVVKALGIAILKILAVGTICVVLGSMAFSAWYVWAIFHLHK